MAQVKVDFSGTTVFVAGGTSGINLSIAERLRRRRGARGRCRRDPVTIPAESSRTATSTTVPEDHPEVATCSC